MNNKSIDIKTIMEEIRKDITVRNLSPEVLSFDKMPLTGEESSDFSMENFLDNDGYLNLHYRLHPYRELKSTRVLIGPFIVFFRKIVRKLIKFYIEPLAEEQTEFNMSVTRCMNQLRNFVNQEQAQDTIAQITNEENIASLKTEINALKKEIQILKKGLEEKE